MSFHPSPEESYLWVLAHHWRSPGTLAVPDGLDWARIAEVGVKNRMAILLECALRAGGYWERLPEEARSEIEASAGRLRANAARMGESLAEFLRQAAAAGLGVVVLKGLSISVNVYGDPAVRPGGDIDILVRRADVPGSIAILENMGIGAFWPNLMADPFYERHHLHHQRCSPDLSLWYEIHWALDHPYTTFTFDYEAMLDRAAPGTLLGSPVRELAPPDLLISLAVHLVKHAVYLPDAAGRDDLARAVLADGMLMYYLDIAETIRWAGDRMDWQALLALTVESGAGEAVGAVLHACRKLLDADVPDEVLRKLAPRGGGALAHRAMNAVVEREIAQYLGKPPDRLWDLVLMPNGAFILRPIRLLESAPYFFASRNFLERRYGRSGWGVRIGHFLKAVGQFGAFGWDSVYFAVERYRRLKRIGYSTSLFNRLETGG